MNMNTGLNPNGLLFNDGMNVLDTIRDDIRKYIYFYSNEGEEKLGESSYNVYSSDAAYGMSCLISKYKFGLYDNVIQNLCIVDGNTYQRRVRDYPTAKAKAYLLANPLEDIFAFMTDVVLLGVGGYYWSEENGKPKRIPMFDKRTTIRFLNSPDEYLMFQEFPNSPHVKQIIISPIRIGGVGYLSGDVPKWAKYVVMEMGVNKDGEAENATVRSYFREKPYMIYYYALDDLTKTPNSIGRMVLSTVLRLSSINRLTLNAIEKQVSPPVGVYANTSPHTYEKDANGNNVPRALELDLTPNAVTYFNQSASGNSPVFSMYGATANETISELMSLTNNLQGSLAIGTHNQASVGSTKSNITEGAIQEVNQIQDINLTVDRKKMIDEFLKPIIFRELKRSKILSGDLNSDKDLYFSGMDGDLNEMDNNLRGVLQQVNYVAQVFGESTLQIIDKKKIVEVIKNNSKYDIYVDE